MGNSLEAISRRSLMKWMAMASPAVCGAAPLLANAAHVGAGAGSAEAAGHAGRPRIFYDAEALARLKQMLAANASLHAALEQRGEKLLAAELVPETVAEIGGGQQANYHTPANQIAEMGLTLGLLFQLTGEKRYAEKLREALLYYVRYERWAGPGLAERFLPWHTELDTTEFSIGYAAGYDALHSYLTVADRKTIAEGMIRLSVQPTLDDWILPGARVHALDSMGHNWWGVCVAAAGLCALALLEDDPRAQGWVDAVDAGYEQWFSYRGNVLQNRMPTFERSGPSYEGVGYTNYGVSEYLRYRFAWQNTYPGRKAARMEPLEHLATFFLETLYPTSTGFLTVNFEDCSLEADSTVTLLLMVACGLGGPDAARYLARVDSLPNDPLLSLLRLHPQQAARGEAPTSVLYERMGWATMRSSWEKDATLLAMKSGYTWNHAHADAGTFLLFKQGAPLIIDSGTCNYGRREYATYYRQSRAHNVILFDGQGQSPEDLDHGVKFPGHMHALIDGLGMKYVYADATGPMARWFSRNYRNWLWSGEVVLVVDDLRAHAKGPLQWLLHYEGACTDGSDGSVRLKNGAAEAAVKMIYPAGSQYHEEMGLADHNPDRKIPYLVFTTDGQERLRQFITAICLNPAAMPEIEFLQGLNYIGVRVNTGASVEETYLNLRAIDGSIHMNSGVLMGEWMTDAYMLHVKRPAAGDGVERYFVSDGSYLRRGPRSLIESLTKLTACWAEAERLEVYTDDAAPVFQLGTERPVRSAVCNGRAVAVQYDRERGLATIRREEGSPLPMV